MRTGASRPRAPTEAIDVAAASRDERRLECAADQHLLVPRSGRRQRARGDGCDFTVRFLLASIRRRERATPKFRCAQRATPPATCPLPPLRRRRLARREGEGIAVVTRLAFYAQQHRAERALHMLFALFAPTNFPTRAREHLSCPNSFWLRARPSACLGAAVLGKQEDAVSQRQLIRSGAGVILSWNVVGKSFLRFILRTGNTCTRSSCSCRSRCQRSAPHRMRHRAHDTGILEGTPTSTPGHSPSRYFLHRRRLCALRVCCRPPRTVRS
jgi:hypothetical protein